MSIKFFHCKELIDIHGTSNYWLKEDHKIFSGLSSLITHIKLDGVEVEVRPVIDYYGSKESDINELLTVLDDDELAGMIVYIISELPDSRMTSDIRDAVRRTMARDVLQEHEFRSAEQIIWSPYNSN